MPTPCVLLTSEPDGDDAAEEHHRAESLHPWRLLLMENRMWVGLWPGGKQLCICLPALWALPGRGTGVASAKPTKEHCWCVGKGDVWTVCRSEDGFPCSPVRAALAAACTLSLPGRFGSHCHTTFWMTALDGAKVSSHAQGGACREMSQKQEGCRRKQELFRLGNRLSDFFKIPHFMGFLNSEVQYYIFPWCRRCYSHPNGKSRIIIWVHRITLVVIAAFQSGASS